MPSTSWKFSTTFIENLKQVNGTCEINFSSFHYSAQHALTGISNTHKILFAFILFVPDSTKKVRQRKLKSENLKIILFLEWISSTPPGIWNRTRYTFLYFAKKIGAIMSLLFISTYGMFKSVHLRESVDSESLLLFAYIASLFIAFSLLVTRYVNGLKL